MDLDCTIRAEEAVIRLLFFLSLVVTPSNGRQIRTALRMNMNVGSGMLPELWSSVLQKS
jgi:hypothetical protein